MLQFIKGIFNGSTTEGSKLVGISGYDDPNRKADVIFVHGLAGHPIDTWHPEQPSKNRNQENCWLYWLAEDKELLANNLKLGIWSFGYKVERFHGKAAPRFDQGEDLRSWLTARSIGNRPIIFIAHSLGGLIVKQMLRKAKDKNEKDLIEQIKGIVYLATPHTGSDVSNLVNIINAILQNTLRVTVAVKELEAHNPGLRDLDDWHRNSIEALHIKINAFYELHDTWGLKIVNEDSANPKVKDCHPIPVHADHNTIARPIDEDAKVYLLVKEFIKSCLIVYPQPEARKELERLSNPQ
jgi:pimeloyl-ACP methyl ester carboxylesterase